LLVAALVVWLWLASGPAWPPKRIAVFAVAAFFLAFGVGDVHAHFFLKRCAGRPPSKPSKHVDWVVRERLKEDQIGWVRLLKAHHPDPAAGFFGVCVQCRHVLEFGFIEKLHERAWVAVNRHAITHLLRRVVI